MTQTLFKAGEDGLFVRALEIDDAVRLQAGLGERRCKKVRPRDTPQHLTPCAGGDVCGEERGGGAIDCAVSPASDFMQCAD